MSSSDSKPDRVRLPSGRKELRELIETAQAIRNRKFNPFFLDISLAVETLRKYFPFWHSLDDNCLDAETINHLAEVLNLQKSQLRYQSSALYTSPELLERKTHALSVKRLGEIFLKSWHPIVEREQITRDGLRQGLDYWNELVSYEERKKRLALGRPTRPDATDFDSLLRTGVLTREGFTKNLQGLWKELQAQTEGGKPLEYWSFVRRDDYKETVRRAYYVSFLLTYGFARMLRDDSGMRLVSIAAPTGRVSSGAVSYPIAIPRGTRS